MSECVRRAWLDLDGQVMPLEDLDAGYVCAELDLGWPEVREVVNNRSGASGTDDYTRFFGSRAVSASIRALASLGAVVDGVASAFGRYMRPDLRPELHYVLEREGNPERVLVVRAAGYTWPIDGTGTRNVHLAWVAPDPIARDPLERSASAWSGSSTSPGRNYDLTFNRLYPPGGGSSTTGVIDTPGDVPVKPLLRIYGPITAAHVKLTPTVGTPFSLYFAQSFVIGSGQYVEVDTAAHTATVDGDPLQPVLSALDWSRSSWPECPPLPNYTNLNLYGSSTAGVTQVEARWYDGYLT
jgi:hypothetical protein